MRSWIVSLTLILATLVAVPAGAGPYDEGQGLAGPVVRVIPEGTLCPEGQPWPELVPDRFVLQVDADALDPDQWVAAEAALAAAFPFDVALRATPADPEAGEYAVPVRVVDGSFIAGADGSSNDGYACGHVITVNGRLPAAWLGHVLVHEVGHVLHLPHAEGSFMAPHGDAAAAPVEGWTGIQLAYLYAIADGPAMPAPFA